MLTHSCRAWTYKCFYLCVFFKQASEILFVKRAENRLNGRITLKSTGGHTREKRLSSKLCADTKRQLKKKMKRLIVSSRPCLHQVWDLRLPVSAARLAELAHEEAHSGGPLQLHLRVLSQEVWEARQREIPQGEEPPGQADHLRADRAEQPEEGSFVSRPGWDGPGNTQIKVGSHLLCRKQKEWEDGAGGYVGTHHSAAKASRAVFSPAGLFSKPVGLVMEKLCSKVLNLLKTIDWTWLHVF